MNKLSLELESLAVQSFETGASTQDVRGTVHGHAPTRNGLSCVSCNETCANCPVTPTYAATCYC